MNHFREVPLPLTDVSHDQTGSSWLLFGYAILVAVAIYYMCVS
jgi:hypothetical protein